MPLNDRNYVFAAQFTTGVAAPNQGFRQVAGAGDFTSNGNRVSQNNFVLDGVDNNSNMQDFLNGATYAVRPPPDALAEFKVEAATTALSSAVRQVPPSMRPSRAEPTPSTEAYGNTSATTVWQRATVSVPPAMGTMRTSSAPH
jgi:hypothetical protein